MPTSRCTVIIVNWNGKRYLQGCLTSLREQTFRDFDVLFVDNASQDGSVEYVIQEFPEVKVLRLHENLGFCKANNLGIEEVLARGSEFVLLLNNDTTVAPDCLEQLLAAASQDSRTAVVCPKIFFADHPDTLWYAGADFSLWTSRSRYTGWRQKDEAQYDRRRAITQATGCAMLVRSSAIADVGPLDECLWAYVEDVDWSIRFRGKGYLLFYEPQSRVWHHDGGTSVAGGSQYRRQYLTTRNLLLLCRKHTRWFQLPSFLLGFLLCHVAYYGCLRLATKDFRSLRAMYEAIVSSIQGTSSVPEAHTLGTITPP
jgi:GT2 family glycosyltransferase